MSAAARKIGRTHTPEPPAMTLAHGDFRDIPVAERQRQDEEGAEAFDALPMPDLDVVIEKIRRLSSVAPSRFKAFGYLVEDLGSQQLHVQPKRGQHNVLLTRLRAAHACRRKDDPGFVQLPPSPSGPREWRCEGCGAIVNLPAGKA